MAMQHPFRKKEGASFSRSLLVLPVLYLAVFAIYVFSLPKLGPEASLPHVKADGIVALTGGDARLEAAVALLEEGAAKRLLISGVNSKTTKDELKQRLHGG